MNEDTGFRVDPLKTEHQRGGINVKVWDGEELLVELEVARTAFGYEGWIAEPLFELHRSTD